MGRKIPALLAIAAMGVSCDGSGKPASVTLKGRRVEVSVLAVEKERRSAGLSLRTLPDGAGTLLLWPRDRFMKVEPGALDSYDVAFLDGAGKVVDTGRLDRGSPEGLVPAVEARAALLLPEGDLKKRGVQKGDPAAISGAPAAQELPLMTIGGVPARVELALSEADRNHGLMFRPRMSPDDGMLFAYERQQDNISFWMRNTLVPLDIAFFKEDGTLVNVNETPIADDPRQGPWPTAPAAGSARFVLEMNLGWFKKKGLVDAEGKPKPGVKAVFPPEAVRGTFE